MERITEISITILAQSPNWDISIGGKNSYLILFAAMNFALLVGFPVCWGRESKKQNKTEIWWFHSLNKGYEHTYTIKKSSVNILKMNTMYFENKGKYTSPRIIL